MKQTISLIVATKDRPADLRKLLDSLRCQTVPPRQIVVVDAGSESVEPIVREFSDLVVRSLTHWPPSAAAQRNHGIRVCDAESTLIGFADDDTTFEPTAFENMLKFWETAAPETLGAAFNIRNYPARPNSFLKHSRLAEHMGFYSPRPGRVSRSGWQTVCGEIRETQFVEWLPSGASVFRRRVFEEIHFDEVFESYSYLEDLDMSYGISRKGRLAIVADAGFYHFPSPGGRVSARRFGRCEVRNRLYFVRKHGLSVGRCYIGLAIRFAMSVASGIIHRDIVILQRALGNVEELLASHFRIQTQKPFSTWS